MTGLFPIEVGGHQYQCLCRDERCVMTKTDKDGRVIARYDVLPVTGRCSCRAWFWSKDGECKHLRAVRAMIESLNGGETK